MLQTSVYELEINSWLKKLDVLQQRNVSLKNKLTEVIKNDVDHAVLEHVEYFLNNFINKDAVFALLRYDIAEQLKAANKIDEGKTVEILDSKQKKLRQDILKMEQEFTKLELDFNDYINNFSTA